MHWICGQLRNVVPKVRNGTTETQVVETENTVPVSRIETISSGCIDYERTGSINNSADIEPFMLNKGDILFSHINSLPMIGNCALYVDERPLCHGMNLLRLEPRKGVCARWLEYWLKSPLVRQWVEASAKPAINQASISTTSVKALPIIIPSNNEQTLIADFLDHETARIDALIEEQQCLIDLLQEKRQAIIFHAVTKGLEPDVPIKHSGVGWLGSLPEHWQHSRIGWLCEVGNGMTPSRDDPSYWSEGDFPWLNSGNVNKERITDSDQFVSEHALNECSLPILEPRTVVIAITGEGKTRGTASIAEVRSTISQHLAYIAPRNELHLEVEFLLYWLKSQYRRIRFESQGWGSTKAAITCRDIRQYPIPLPSRSEQMQICRWLKEKNRNLNALENEAVKAIRLMKEHRSTLISAAVTGKVDVRGWKPQDTPVKHDLPQAAEAEAQYG